jgi:hypothetical protein
MQPRCSEPSSPASPFFVCTLALFAMLRAQEPAPQAPPASPAPAGPEAPAPAATTGTSWGQILVDSAKVRCWQTANSPLFDDVLGKGSVVQVGRVDGGFRAILLPLGPRGYVSKKYTGDPAEGVVKTKGKAVSFRFRPKGDGAPVTTLREGTELTVVGEKDDWWIVRCGAVEAWLPEAEIQVSATASEPLAAAWAELQKTHLGEAAAWQQAVTAAQEQRKRADEHAKLAVELQERLRVELGKPPAAQQFAPIAESCQQLLAKLDADSPTRAVVENLEKRIATQQWVRDAAAVRDAEPQPPKDLPQLPPGEVKDSLERFQAVGWLRYEKDLAGLGQYLIEKGGQTQYVLTCSTGRYDLAMFVDREVGLLGPRRRPATESMRILDIEKIEILGKAPH